MSRKVSIGQVKRDLSDLINRVSYAGERIIITSRGKPKAALVNMEDYQHLINSENRVANIKKWTKETRDFSYQLEKRHGGPVDVDEILEASQKELEQR